MASRIKQLGAREGIDQALLFRERDLIDQINRALAERDALMAPLLAMLRVGRPICAGRCGTNGTGGIAFSDVVGASVSVSGTDLRITFDSPRPVGPNGPLYMPFAVAFTAASSRFYHDSSVSEASYCEVRLRTSNTAVAVNVAATAVNLALFVLDRD